MLTPESHSRDESSDHEELQQMPRQPRPRPRRGQRAYTAQEERAVVAKFDRRLVLFVALLYLLSFLDRSNIGNARVAGMDADLQTRPPRADWYEWALSAFYVTYIAFGWMALLWHVWPAHVYVAALVVVWGLAAALQAVTASYPGLVVLRALLGMAEAGFTGIPLYLARFFRRDELATRTAIFIAAAPLATSFAASLAWAILALGRHAASPIAPWRLLFLVEGFPSIVAGVAAWHVLPDAPGEARYLTGREKQLAVERLRVGGSGGGSDGDSDDDNDDDSCGEKSKRHTSFSLLSILVDPVAWTTASMFFLANMAYSSLPVFLPTILHDMGHDAVAAQALAAPPYLGAFVVVLATARVSDQMRARSPLLIAHALASAAGYGVLALDSSVVARTSLLRYVAVYPAAIGFFNVVVLLITWNLNNQRGPRRKGAAFALFQLVGQCGPLLGIRLYPDADAPLFLPGMRAMAAAMLGVAVLAVVLRLLLRRRNAQRDEDEREDGGWNLDGDGDDDRGHGEEDGLVEQARQRRPVFRYML